MAEDDVLLELRTLLHRVSSGRYKLPVAEARAALVLAEELTRVFRAKCGDLSSVGAGFLGGAGLLDKLSAAGGLPAGINLKMFDKAAVAAAAASPAAAPLAPRGGGLGGARDPSASLPGRRGSLGMPCEPSPERRAETGAPAAAARSPGAATATGG
eukprot:1490567-Prymnesium_polylepis.1